jgi:hypothetical protein
MNRTRIVAVAAAVLLAASAAAAEVQTREIEYTDSRGSGIAIQLCSASPARGDVNCVKFPPRPLSPL